MNESKCRHHTLDILAPAFYWRTLGFMVDTEGRVYGGPHGIEELLILGLATGVQNEQVIAWAIVERARRREADARDHAIQTEAAAIAKLACSINESSTEGFMERLLPQLSENLRYAIKQQLKR